MQKIALLKKSIGAAGYATKEKHSLKNVGGQIAASLTARYYKGISADGDNVILVYEKQSNTTDGNMG